MREVVRNDSFKMSGDILEQGLFRVVEFDAGEDGHLAPSVQIAKVHSGDRASLIVSDDGLRMLSLPESGRYVSHGDILQVGRNGNVRVLLSKNANANTLLVTERCNNLCKFCSQPPKDVDDEVLLAQAALALIDFNSNDVVGISGGEPLLYGEKFVSFMRALHNAECPTGLHVLTNGRGFKDLAFTKDVVEASKGRYVAFGIPLYSAVPELHDDLVGAAGAWSETITGIINAAHQGFSIELRFIPTKLNYQELPSFVSFIARSFPFVDQLSIMNLEPKGWARKNWNELYIPPLQYDELLNEAVRVARVHGLPVSLFNFPLCHLSSEKTKNVAVKSISDWKNYYPEECSGCMEKSVCCGYFSSASGLFLDKPRRM